MRVIADGSAVEEAIGRLADAVADAVDMGGGETGPAVVGIRRRGDVIGRRLAERLEIEDVGALDITLYRDDFSRMGHMPTVRTTDIDFGIDNRDVILVDDVLMTGRSIRAALQSLMDMGRPRRVWLAVLVDRGGRELPIAADAVALDLSDDGLAADELVEVRLEPTDERDAVLVRAAEEVAS
ncbi:MAG: bifunctional pyr operon transcriptional regulator/uracil phosphoribosyltransferase PyrR [Phycisphaeraceae bacterium]|nr:bifunctional pyr operon transcriptional regulator/uracil phosphoribosyltransferase PyrR [Phycisphaeraceae bacterium]